MSDDLVASARAALDGVTPGPWDWEINRASKAVELCGGKGASDLTVMSFARYGMNSAAPVFWTWDGNYGKEVKRADELAVTAPGRDHHAKWFARIDHPDARFIAAARSLVPDMADRIAALTAERDAAEAELATARELIAMLEGEQARADKAEALLAEAVEAAEYALLYVPTPNVRTRLLATLAKIKEAKNG